MPTLLMLAAAAATGRPQRATEDALHVESIALLLVSLWSRLDACAREKTPVVKDGQAPHIED